MARGRLISKSLGSSRRFHSLLREGGKLGEFCQVLFPLIIANTDDFGRMPGDAFTIKNVVLPTSRRPERDFEVALRTIDRVGLVVRYAVADDIYLQVNKFDEHQPNLSKRTKSKFPEVPETPGTPVIFPLKRTESNLTESNPELRRRAADELFEEFWQAYPKRKAKDAARRAWDKRRPDEALLALMLSAIARDRRTLDWTKERGRYIPYPATWLNAGQWTDEADSPLPLSTSHEFRCPHTPPCLGRNDCHVKQTLAETKALT